MYTKTKQMIFDYLVEETGNLQERSLNVYTANYICEKFIISRSLASHYLNELFKEKELIKVNERPVLYFHRKTIQKNTKNIKLRDEYDSIDDIYKMLHTGVSTFTNVIGSDYSLRNSLVNVKKALHYPDNGLPIVLIGKSGSGRKFISQCVYTYCKSQSLLETNSSYSLIQCGIKNDDMIFQELFSESGILNDDKTGFVVFEDIQNTSFEIQNKLVEYMDIKPKIRWMFLNQNWDEKQLSPSLRSRLLSMISIPSLKERTIHEKELFIIHFVEEQAKKVKEPIWITDYYMEVMIAKEFDNSIENLRNIVIKSFATSYEKKKDKIVLDLSCIPTELKTNVYFYDKEKSCELKDYNSIYHKITIDLFESVLQNAQEYYLHCGDNSSLYSSVEKFNDYIMFKLPKFENTINQYSAMIKNVAEMTLSRYRVSLSSNAQQLLTYSLYCQSIESKIFNEFLKENQDYIEKILEMLRRAEELAYSIVDEAGLLLEKTYSVDFNALVKMISILNLKYDNLNVQNEYSTGILICHGYSTASSIASAANTLLGEQVFTAFDMPLDVQIDEIVYKIQSYLDEKRYLDDLIVLVDMGSLEQIGNRIKKFNDVNIGILNNTTTAMALEVGQCILQKMDTEEILSKVSQEIVCHYDYFPKKAKEKAIVFTSESGMSIADKIKKLFTDSIPKTIPIQLLSYDYYHILQEDIQEDLINNYDVLFVAGTMDPKLDGVQFISLSEIIDLSSINKIEDIFGLYMSEEEIKRFTDDLIKNFSLTNVIESVTILNPKPLLNIVEKSIHKLEREQQRLIHPRILIGLYVHVCCFVERMVKHEPIKSYPNLIEFEKEQSDFIENVLNSFDELQSHYSIEIPTSEIGYIYDYINMLNVEDKNTYVDE